MPEGIEGELPIKMVRQYGDNDLHRTHIYAAPFPIQYRFRVRKAGKDFTCSIKRDLA